MHPPQLPLESSWEKSTFEGSFHTADQLNTDSCFAISNWLLDFRSREGLCTCLEGLAIVFREGESKVSEAREEEELVGESKASEARELEGDMKASEARELVGLEGEMASRAEERSGWEDLEK